MKSVNEKILVSCDLGQKDFMEIDGMTLRMANLYEVNYREKSPVIAIAKQTKGEIVKGDILICHHNHFYPPSPYFLYDDLYSIPFNQTIFGTFDSDGILTPVCGNMICEKVNIETPFSLPNDQIKQHIDRYIIKDAGWTSYQPGQLIFTRPHSGYVIVYNWNNIETRVVKVDSSMVCGVLK